MINVSVALRGRTVGKEKTAAKSLAKCTSRAGSLISTLLPHTSGNFIVTIEYTDETTVLLDSDTDSDSDTGATASGTVDEPGRAWNWPQPTRTRSTLMPRALR